MDAGKARVFRPFVYSGSVSWSAKKAALQGATVSISWRVRAPYLRRADLSVADRLATLTHGIPDGGWLARDETGAVHRLLGASLEASAEADEAPRWMATGAVPAWVAGEVLELTWGNRSAPTGRSLEAVVLEGEGTHVWLEGPEGRIQVLRGNGHQVAGRKDERWVVTGRKPPAWASEAAAPLMASVMEAPTEVEPRLVFADWLAQRGDPRGAFINLHCELDGLPMGAPEWPEVHARVSRLEASHPEWQAAQMEQLVAGRRLFNGGKPELRRGFVEAISLWSEEDAPLALRSMPLRRLRLREPPEACPVEELEIFGAMRRAGALDLCGRSWLPELRALGLRESGIGVQGTKALAAVPFRRLRSLDLHGAAIRDSGAKALAEASWLPGLRWLELGANQLSEVGLGALLPALKLEHLSLRANSKLAGQLAPLAALEGLNHLGVATSWQLEDLGPLRPLLEGAHSLDLSNPKQPIDQAAVDALASFDLSRLNVLRMNTTRMAGLATALLANPTLGRLRRLSLRGASLQDAEVHALVGSAAQGLVELDLSGNRLTDAGALALAEWPGRRHVTHLSLDDNRRIKEVGLRALLEAPDFDPVSLDLWGVACRSPLLRALRARFGDALKCEFSTMDPS